MAITLIRKMELFFVKQKGRVHNFTSTLKCMTTVSFSLFISDNGGLNAEGKTVS